jgi:hypothetical protein
VLYEEAVAPDIDGRSDTEVEPGPMSAMAILVRRGSAVKLLDGLGVRPRIEF